MHAYVQARKAVGGLQSSGLLQAHGIAVSRQSTGEQWDFPNAWPNLMSMLIEGLHNTQRKPLRSLVQR